MEGKLWGYCLGELWDPSEYIPIIIECCNAKVMFAVGMPVTRHPPHIPGRAVFPHPVLPLYSLPRKTVLSSISSSSDLGYARSCYSHPVENLVEFPPGETPSLPTPSVEPFEYRLNNYPEEVAQRSGVSSHSIVIVVSH